MFFLNLTIATNYSSADYSLTDKLAAVTSGYPCVILVIENINDCIQYRFVLTAPRDDIENEHLMFRIHVLEKKKNHSSSTNNILMITFRTCFDLRRIFLPRAHHQTKHVMEYNNLLVQIYTQFTKISDCLVEDDPDTPVGIEEKIFNSSNSIFQFSQPSATTQRALTDKNKYLQ